MKSKISWNRVASSNLASSSTRTVRFGFFFSPMLKINLVASSKGEGQILKEIHNVTNYYKMVLTKDKIMIELDT